jgi:hypothetical protein
MTQVMLDNFFWAAALVGEAALTVVLLRKSRWRKFPAFAALIALPIATSMVLLPFRWMTDYGWYRVIYRGYVPLNFLLQLAVVVELARIVLRPTGTWVRDARKQFVLSAAAGTLLALTLAYLVAPPAASRLESFQLRADLFTSLLICELFIAVTLASNRLGLGWKNHVMAIGHGFTAWSIVATAVDSLHSYFGARHLYDMTESIQSFMYLGVLWYWCVQLWREEPARQPISAQLRKFIVALHERVQYDLGEAEQ